MQNPATFPHFTYILENISFSGYSFNHYLGKCLCPNGSASSLSDLLQNPVFCQCIYWVESCYNILMTDTSIQRQPNDLSQVQKLRQAIDHLEEQRSLLGDDAVDAAIAGLRQKLAELEASPPPVENKTDAPARARAPGAPAERKLVTILFADISGFTALSETLDPEAVRDLMNACFETLVPSIEKYGGVVDKYIGDEVMALFGAPAAHENDAERALRAVLEMKDALANFNARRGARLGIHFGINTGLVIAGGVGTAQHQDYSVMGDAANLASRLADLGENGQALVGEATYRLCAPLFEFQALPPATLKGKRQPQAVYELLRLRAQPGQVRGLEPLGLRAPLVGRKSEFDVLARALRRMEETLDYPPPTGDQIHGGLLVVLGEAGVGKSRLIAEARRQTELPWFEGRCLSYGETFSYHPFISLLHSLIGAPPNAEAQIVQTHLHDLLADLLPQRRNEAFPYLADLLGLALEPEERRRLDSLASESRRWQVFQSFENLLFAQARHAPTVIFLEDMHWADPTSLALLEQLLPLTQRLPLLFLLAARPHDGRFGAQTLPVLQQNTWTACQTIHLAPLSDADSRRLVEYLLEIEGLEAALRQLILSRAEGNPLFLEEILRTLISQGALVNQEGRWRVASGIQVEQLRLPDTLQGVIQARLDRLEGAERNLLQIASVIGRIFWRRVLDEILSEEGGQTIDDGRPAEMEAADSRAITERLSHLERIELIRLTRQYPDLEYIFKHVLVQEAAYHTLLREQRRIFHLRVARTLEKLYANALEEQYGLIARHYEAASLLDPNAAGPRALAVHYLRLAGRRAHHSYTLDEAESYYRRALTLVAPEDKENRRQALLELGLVYLAQGNFSRGGECYAEAFRLQSDRSKAETRFARRPLRIASLGDSSHIKIEPGMVDTAGSTNLIFDLFAGLVQYDEEMNIIPYMAENWQIDAEGRRYRFYLRRDATWSDGEPLKAQDFVYAWRRWLHPQNSSPANEPLHVIRGALAYRQSKTDDPQTIEVRALDEHTLEIELEQPLAYFLPLLTLVCFMPLPTHRWPPAHSPQEAPPGVVVNGPFRLAEWSGASSEQGGTIALEANRRFCGERRGNLQWVELHFGTPADQVRSLILNDEADEIQAGGDLLYEQFQGRLPIQQVTMPMVQYAWLNPNAPPLDDLRVRRAISLAVDRPRLVQRIEQLSKAVKGARGGLIPPGIPGHTPEMCPIYDEGQALALLRQAGYASFADLPPIEVLSPGKLKGKPYSLTIEQWRTAGLSIREIIVDWDEFNRMLEYEPPHISIGIWAADYLDPHNFIKGIPFICSFGKLPMDYWQAVERAGCMLDVHQRMALYHDLDRQIVIGNAWCIPLFYRTVSYVAQPRLKNVHYRFNFHLALSEIIIEDDDR